MTRVIPAPLLAALSASPRKGAECVVIEATDGTVAGFTSWDGPLTVDVGNGDMICAPTMNLSTLTLEAGLDASIFEFEVPATGEFTEAKVDGGKWRDAQVWLVRVSPGVAGVAPMMRGLAAETRVEGRRAVIEVRNQADLLNQQLGEVLTPFCDAELGDAECTFPLVPVAATVTAVTDAMRFTLSYAGTFADDHFNLGKVEFTSGALDGIVSKNLFDFASLGAGAGSVVLWHPLPAAPDVGDTLEISQGCPKTRAACKAFHGDARPFRGFPDMPGTEQLLQYPTGEAA